MPEDPLAELRRMARAAMNAAHAPYSDFRVGAALQAEDGRTFAGCNVENASYPVTMCAERVALGSAIASGARRFVRLFLCSGASEPIPPCGMCRQALAEFGSDLEVISEGMHGTRATWLLAELLPARFVLEDGSVGGRSANGSPGGTVAPRRERGEEPER